MPNRKSAPGNSRPKNAYALNIHSMNNSNLQVNHLATATFGPSEASRANNNQAEVVNSDSSRRHDNNNHDPTIVQNNLATPNDSGVEKDLNSRVTSGIRVKETLNNKKESESREAAEAVSGQSKDVTLPPVEGT